MTWQGVYLAEDVGKCDQYTTVDGHYKPSSELHRRLYGQHHAHPGHVYYVLICRVTLGLPAITTQFGRSAKHRDTGAPLFPVSSHPYPSNPRLSAQHCNADAPLSLHRDLYERSSLTNGAASHHSLPDGGPQVPPTHHSLTALSRDHQPPTGPHHSLTNGGPQVGFRELAPIPDVSPPMMYHSLIAGIGGALARYREFVFFHGEYIEPVYLLAYQRCRNGTVLRAL
jgi:hypothetical protein